MQHRQTNFRWFVAIASLVSWFGVVLRFYLTLHQAIANGETVVQGMVTYFGYFTILTNILVAVALSVPLLAPESRLGKFFTASGTITAITTNILLVGLAYFFLLRSLWDPQGWELVADVVLHYITPTLFLIYWWIRTTRQGLQQTDVVTWSAYPIGYLIYILIRGEIIDDYPYPFIDINTLGYPQALLNALGLWVAFGAIALGLILSSRLGHRVKQRGSAPSLDR